VDRRTPRTAQRTQPRHAAGPALCEQRGTTGGQVWFTPAIAKERFKLAPVTRTAGLQELRDLDLVETHKAPVSHDGTFISFHRLRNVHTLTLK
jgi:hypothetical protein